MIVSRERVDDEVVGLTSSLHNTGEEEDGPKNNVIAQDSCTAATEIFILKQQKMTVEDSSEYSDKHPEKEKRVLDVLNFFEVIFPRGNNPSNDRCQRKKISYNIPQNHMVVLPNDNRQQLAYDCRTVVRCGVAKVVYTGSIWTNFRPRLRHVQ